MVYQWEGQTVWASIQPSSSTPQGKYIFLPITVRMLSVSSLRNLCPPPDRKDIVDAFLFMKEAFSSRNFIILVFMLGSHFIQINFGCSIRGMSKFLFPLIFTSSYRPICWKDCSLPVELNWNGFATFSEINWLYIYVYLWNFILLQGSICLFSCQYHSVLIAVAL